MHGSRLYEPRTNIHIWSGYNVSTTNTIKANETDETNHNYH